MKSAILSLFVVSITVNNASAQPLPFSFKTETYREKDTGITVFAIRLEQPFLAEEFEKSNYLRLESTDNRSYLIYPKETKFRQKHAEFYGRLKGTGKAKVKLSYEIIAENLDGSRKVDVRQAEIEIAIPAEPTGISVIHKDWARKQNEHFANLLRYYPETSFFEYVLLQSRERYGVAPPPLPKSTNAATSRTEAGLYHTFSGGLALQQALQYQTLTSGPNVGDLNIHISKLAAPSLRSHDYPKSLAKKKEQGVAAKVNSLARLVPADHYLLHFNSMTAANELMELSTQWGESLLRMFTVNAREQNLREKYEFQLCVRRDPITKLFNDKVIAEVAVSGSDFFIEEGTDVTLLFKLAKPDVFEQAAAKWLDEIRKTRPDVQVRQFNYRGHKVEARYTSDRMVSSFVIRHEDTLAISNSHVAIRKIIDAMIGRSPSLYAADDYHYVSTILPPSDAPNSAYLYASEAFLKRLVSPQFKIAEKRRLQSFNNLVMLNNASMFYRLENGNSPQTLSDLVEGRFVNLSKIVDPAGGAYAFDAENDTATSSVYNRIKYLTPILELDVLNVSSNEQQEYGRYKQRYESTWRAYFDPIALRITTGNTVKVETCVLPFANSNIDVGLRSMLDARPQLMSTSDIARSAVASIAFVPGRKHIAGLVREIPGMRATLEADPTLTDLSWLGDQVSLHFLDDDTILEIDPTLLRSVNMLGSVDVPQQAAVSALIAATNYPVYMTIDVEDEAKAARLLQNLGSRIFLEGDNLLGFQTKFDSYRLPDYKKHQLYVLSYQLYAVKLRLHVALVGGKLVAATKHDALKQVIDASASPDKPTRSAHVMLRLNFAGMDRMKQDFQLYWSERLREASHRNIMPIYNLIKLYGVPIGDVNKLSDAKYGVTYFCPGGGDYVFDAARDQVSSTVFGNRRDAKQSLTIDDKSPFSQFINSLDEIVATLTYTEDALLATVEVKRKQAAKKADKK
ncbi:MAG: hypothetical protein O3A00_07820 [Planctomycetota bacterium]|nr:hypothetical protein [Planctomycetota bacterium]